MKLNLLFIVMDLLTLLAYPILYVYEKLRPFGKSKERNPLANIFVTSYTRQLTNWKL